MSPFSRILILLLVSVVSFQAELHSQNATLFIAKNGIAIDPNNMAVNDNDVISVQVVNKDKAVKYKITNLSLEVRRVQTQAIKGAQQKKAHLYDTLQTHTFESSPKIIIKMSDYSNKENTRSILKILSVEQIKSGVTTKVDWLTYGKEYIFWYN